ncbi:glycosyltransferase family 2 protein [Rhodopseudomonas sp.]|uniref:glycosyltransferase family 2 protein n=1 Tax=Rhodopseudomonas sp. TaxID=1078 RepID=UPI0039E3784A
MISVVIPAFNEEAAISETVRSVRSTLEGAGIRPVEIIVVDDASTDKTGELAREAGAAVIQKIQNIGYGHSLKLGITAATFDTIAIIDADATYPVEQIPNLLAQHRRGFHMVVGARTGKHYRESWYKHPMRLLLKALVEFAAGRSIPDPNSGLRVFSRSDALQILPTLCDQFSFTTSMTLAYMMRSLYVLYIDIDYDKRVGKTKVKLLKDSLVTLQYIVQAVTYYNPIKIFLVLSGLTGVSALFLLGVGLIFSIKTAIQLGVGAVLTTVLIFALGLLADLLRQILAHSRPNNEGDGSRP